MYRLTQARQKEAMDRFVSAPEAKSLREELALVRMLIEEHLNRMQGDEGLVAHSHIVNQLTQTCKELVKTCNQIEFKIGDMLAKATIVAIGKRIGEVLANELMGVPNYEELMDRIVPQITHVIVDANNEVVEAE